MERYINEFANAKIKRIKGCDGMREEYKQEKIEKIEKLLTVRERGLVTIDETIKMIAEV